MSIYVEDILNKQMRKALIEARHPFDSTGFKIEDLKIDNNYFVNYDKNYFSGSVKILVKNTALNFDFEIEDGVLTDIHLN